MFKKWTLKIEFANFTILLLNQSPINTIFPITRFPGSPKFVLSGDPLYSVFFFFGKFSFFSLNCLFYFELFIFYKSKYFEFWLALPSLIIFHDKFKYSMFTRGHGTETFCSCFLLKGDNLSFFILLPSPSYIWKRQMSEVDSRLGGVK